MTNGVHILIEEQTKAKKWKQKWFNYYNAIYNELKFLTPKT